METFGGNTTVSVLIVIIAVSAFIAFSYHSGRRKNKEICSGIFNQLIKVFKPDDQTFTSIGGAVGH
ncbi:MAG TPA: hypothetical protein VLM43_05390, partial [Desulfobacterales bacterium]|nr:hypothetical protein [Desulfobacterales bacterium]